MTPGSIVVGKGAASALPCHPYIPGILAGSRVQPLTALERLAGSSSMGGLPRWNCRTSASKDAPAFVIRARLETDPVFLRDAPFEVRQIDNTYARVTIEVAPPLPRMTSFSLEVRPPYETIDAKTIIAGSRDPLIFGAKEVVRFVRTGSGRFLTGFPPRLCRRRVRRQRKPRPTSTPLWKPKLWQRN